MPNPGGLSMRVVVKKNDLPTLPAAVTAILAAEVARGAYAIEASAKQKCPVRTGALRRSIHTVLSNGGMRAVVGPSVDYSAYIEFGTRHMAARPYMRPAAEAELPRTIENLKRALRGLG